MILKVVGSRKQANFYSKTILGLNVLAAAPVIIILGINNIMLSFCYANFLNYSNLAAITEFSLQRIYHYWPIFFVWVLCYSGSLLLSTIWLIVYSIRLNDSFSLITLKSVALTLRGREKNPALKIIAVLISTAACFMLRIACLLLLLIDLPDGKLSFIQRIPNVVWFIAALWIPLFTPVSLGLMM
jgi:hypothetical protein